MTDPIIQRRSFADQIRYYASRIDKVATPDGQDADMDLLGLAMALRMTAKNIDDAEKQKAAVKKPEHVPVEHISLESLSGWQIGVDDSQPAFLHQCGKMYVPQTATGLLGMKRVMTALMANHQCGK